MHVGKQHVILSYSWLQKHNPEINWETKEVWMACCLTSCCTSHDELRAVCWSTRIAAAILRQLHEGLVPSICAVDMEWHRDDGYNPEVNGDDFPDLTMDPDDDDNDNLKKGDQILYTVFTPAKEVRAEEIRAGSTISQQLAEAFTWKSTIAKTLVPP
jgi:hypothetical protein